MGGLEHQIIKDNAIMVFEIYEKQSNLLHIDMFNNYINYDLYDLSYQISFVIVKYHKVSVFLRFFNIKLLV